MNRIVEQIKGRVRVEVFGAFPESLLNASALSALELWELECVNENTLRFNAHEGDLAKLRELARACSCEMTVIESSGGSENRRFARRRVWLLITAAVLAAVFLASTLFVWDIDVRGNKRLSRAEIMRALEDCGLGCGSFWPSLSSDMIRSKMLLRLPQLGWMSVNVCSSRAIVLIEEREEKPVIYNEAGAADIAASKPGIIRRVSVLRGRALVEPGQAVTEGETLVTGSLESLAGEPRTVYARATVMADTWAELNAVCPETGQHKQPKGVTRSRFAIIFGKRRVNLYLSSGKAIDGCDKIVAEYTLGAEGLFALPLRIVKESYVPYGLSEGTGYDADAMKLHLSALLDAGTDGQVLQQSFTEANADGLFVVTLRAHCLENIAVDRTINW